MTYRLVLFLFLSYQPEYCAFCCHCRCRCFCRRRSCWLFVLKVSTINYKLMCVFNKYKQTAIVVGMCNLPAGQPAGCLTKRRTRRPEQTTRDVWPGGATNKPNQPANRCLRHLHFKHTPTIVPSSLLPDPPTTFWKKYITWFHSLVAVFLFLAPS